ncbi:putative oxidoreductase YrbE [Cryptotermes secundus]|uniref:Putative oxidoreductase YrbE n=1 Tax=Cryptotermes secundus TaxID=105785 RepID=A0A2J7QKJ2_9NEOP|nr:myo-inositol 2-dehydrogenase [Cryptotermes secundus]PNF29102.1 putative oxidoreductase YrbE [Cryptotermes secundus]
MATLKFKDPSPYKQELPKAPVADFLYSSFLKDIALQQAERGTAVQMALFGVGRAGSIHLSALAHNPRVKLLYIVDDVQEKWDAIRQYWKLDDTVFLCSNDADKVFLDPRVRAVVVATPTNTHEWIVTTALNHGKDVFCEKPVAESISSAEHCYKQAKKAGKLLFCAFQRRFDPAFNNIKERVRSGEVGHVHTIKTCSRDAQLPSLEYLRSSSGIFHDTAVHDIDLICWILGEYPTCVATQASTLTPEIAEIGDYDTVVITLQFPSGTLGIIDISRLSSHGYDQRIEVFGPRGMLTSSNERPMHGIESHIGFQGGNTMPIYYSFPSRYKMAYLNEMEHFLDILQDKAKPTIMGHETLAVSKIASACEESARTRQFVQLQWEPEYIPPN